MSRSVNRGFPALGNNANLGTSKVTYVNEKSRVGKDNIRLATPRPRNTQKGNLSIIIHLFIAILVIITHNNLFI